MLTIVVSKEQDAFDEMFAYNEQGRIVRQARGADKDKLAGAGYVYISHTNKLLAVTPGGGGELDKRFPAVSYQHFEYDAEGNMTKDNSKDLTIAYDWRGMPVEFKRQNSCYDIHEKIVCDSTKLEIAYDGSGRRVSKTRYAKHDQFGYWTRNVVTHYTGIGTEVRETHVNGQDETKVVVNMPNGLGRYMPEDAVDGLNGVSGSQLAGYRPPAKFEWYLKNHLGSTMLVYGTSAYNDTYFSGYKGGMLAAYDYRATVVAMRTKQQVAKCCPPFGEQVDLTEPTDKVTENFTGKEKDDETELNYFGARYLDPMLGLWTSVDPARQFTSPYLYAGNGYNPVNGVDPDGNQYRDVETTYQNIRQAGENNNRLEAAAMGDDVEELYEAYDAYRQSVANVGNSAGKAGLKTISNATPGGALKPIKGAIKRSIKEEVKEDEKESGSTWQSIKNVGSDLLDFAKGVWNALWEPSANESVIPEDQQ